MSCNIAVVGRGIVVPGAASIAAFWSNIVAARIPAIGDMAVRWGGDADKYIGGHQGQSERGKTYLRTGFCLSPEFDTRKSVHGLCINVVTQVLAEMRMSRAESDTARCGLVIANTWSGEAELIEDAEDYWSCHTSDGERAAGKETSRNEASHQSLLDTLRSRFGLSGPRLIVDAACASGLHAVKIGIDWIESGAAEIVLVGGLHTVMDPFLYSGLSALGVLSRDGQMAPFAREASGFVPGEGMGMVALMDVDAATRRHLKIRGVIRGLGISSDGRSGSFIAPSAVGQALCYERAYSESGIATHEIDYLEAHGTATQLGDQTELDSLTKFFSSEPGSRRRIPLGAVKSLVGHQLPAAGVVSLLKALLILEHKRIPPSVGRFLPRDELLDHPVFHLPRCAFAHQELQRPMRVGINSFGLGGTNAHLVVEEHSDVIATEPRNLVRRGHTTTNTKGPFAIVGLSGMMGSHNVLNALRDRNVIDREASQPWDTERFGGLSFADYISTKGEAHQARNGCGFFFPPNLEVSIAGLGLGPAHLAEMNPFQVLALVLAKQALAWIANESGPDQLGEKTSVIMVADYGGDGSFRLYRDFIGGAHVDAEESVFTASLNPNAVLSSLPNMISGLIARQFDFRGGHMNFSGDSSTFHQALNLAAAELTSGARDRIVLGAGHLIRGPRSLAHRNGFAEGMGILVLRRLEDTGRTGEPIIATLESAPLLVANARQSPTPWGEASGIEAILSQLTVWRAAGEGESTSATIDSEVGSPWVLKPGAALFQEIPGPENGTSEAMNIRFAEPRPPARCKFAAPKVAPKKVAVPTSANGRDGKINNYIQSLSESIKCFFAVQAAAIRLLQSGRIIESPLGSRLRRIKPNEADIVCRDLRWSDDEGSLTGTLIVDEYHPYFYDHPLDHVPGILLIEAIGQLARAIAIGDDADDNLFVRKLAITFEAPCLKDRNTSITCRIVEEATDAIRVHFVAVQENTRLLDGELSLAKIATRDLCKPVAATNQRWRKAKAELAHKTHAENVLITEWQSSPRGSHATCYALPPSDGHYLLRDFSPFYTVTHVIEAVRQAFTVSAHADHGIGLGTNMVLLSLEVDLGVPLCRSAPVCIEISDARAESTGPILIAKQTATLRADDRTVGRISARNLVITHSSMGGSSANVELRSFNDEHR